MEEDYYKILNVSKNATQDQIKKSFRKLSLKMHPDKYQGSDKKGASEKYANIKEAYDVLSDTDKRKQYDQYGKDFEKMQGMGGMGGMGNMNDLFNMFNGMGGGGFPFGGMPGGGNNRQVQQDIMQKVSISFKESYTGVSKKVFYTKMESCGTCGGIGAESKEYIDTCGMCDGKGFIVEQKKVNQFMYTQTQKTCHKCNGNCEIIREGKSCKSCKGNKHISKRVDLNIPIPAGVDDNFRMMVKGQGNSMYKTPGDLIVLVHVFPPIDKKWSRSKSDLYYDITIKLTEALSGFQKVVEHLDGRQLLFKSENIIKPNQVKKIEGEGMPVVNSSKKGDLYLKFTIEFPDTLSKGDKKQLKNILPKAKDVHIKSLKDTHLYKI